MYVTHEMDLTDICTYQSLSRDHKVKGLLVCLAGYDRAHCRFSFNGPRGVSQSVRSSLTEAQTFLCSAATATLETRSYEIALTAKEAARCSSYAAKRYPMAGNLIVLAIGVIRAQRRHECEVCHFYPWLATKQMYITVYVRNV